MRLRNHRQARPILEAAPDLITLDPAKSRGFWQDRFPTPGPLHLEIGMGKGQFLCGMAQAHPEWNFLGLERYDSVVMRAVHRLRPAQLPNVHLLRGAAEDILDLFAPGELQRIYLNFSDPWPSKGHAKRRLTHPDFLERYRRVMSADAELHLKTDNRGFFEYSLLVFSALGLRLRSLSLDLHAQEPADNVRTEYEELWASRGYPIYRVTCAWPEDETAREPG